MVLRALNDAKSSYVSVTFRREFFVQLHGPGPDADPKRCHFVAKAVHQAFQGPRGVERMELYFVSAADSLSDTPIAVFKFDMKHGEGQRPHTRLPPATTALPP